MSFLPSDYANLGFWYAADSGVYSDAGVTPAGDGDRVQQWNDLSGSGNSLSQPSLAARPTFRTPYPKYANKGAVNFSQVLTVTPYLAGTGTPGTAQATVLIAFRGGGSTGTGTRIALRSAFITIGVDGGLVYWNNATGVAPNYVSRVVPYQAETLYRVAAVVSPTAATCTINGVDRTQNSSYILAQVGNLPVLGDNGGVDFQGDILELIGYTRALSAAEVLRLDRYLAEKWGPSATPSVVLTATSAGARRTTFPAAGFAALYLRAEAFVSSGRAALVLTAAARVAPAARAALVLTARAQAPSSLARARLVLSARAAQVPTLSGSLHVHVSQLPLEVVRGRLAGSAGAVRLSQLVLETVVPFVQAGPHFAKVGSATLRLHAAAVRVAPALAKSATASVVLASAAAASRGYAASGSASLVITALAPAPGRGHRQVAVASLILTASSAQSVSKVRFGGVTLMFRARARNAATGLGTGCKATVIFRARCRDRVPPIDFGDDWIGRFQQGDRVPLLVVVKDQHGTPTDPTTMTPTARVYDLDRMRLVQGVRLARLRGRFRRAYGLPLRLDVRYLPGRYGILYQAPTGGFLGVFLGLFEVVPGGDPASPAIAAHAQPGSSTDAIVAHVGSGMVLAGGSPRLS